jgi:hypothetical protein
MGHVQLSHPIACSARATYVSLCARPVSLCMAADAAACVICACVRSVCVCVRARATISREQGSNQLSLIPQPTCTRTELRRAQMPSAPKAARTHARALSLPLPLSLCIPVSLSLSLSPSLSLALALSLSLSLVESAS